jgi:molybdate transport system substrate-binding protein
LWCALPAKAFALESVSVLADGNLRAVISQIGRSYSRDFNIIVNTSFAPVAVQETQISEGAAADILITPRVSWIEDLKMRGLVDVYSQTAFTRDQLALVGPAGSQIDANLKNRFPVAEIIRMIDYEPLFVMANPETLPEGGIAKEAMRAIDAADYMEPYTVYLKQRDEMLEMVNKSDAYGVFLYSSIRHYPGIKLLDVFPESTHKPFDYYAVVIAGDNMDGARKFIEYLKTPPAQAIFKKNGFLPLED